ncbi:unnamed protein product, partial [Hymenolepis diminuta]
RSLYTTVSSEPKTDKTNIYLDACDLLPSWHPETTVIQHNHFPILYFGRFRRPRKIFKGEPTLNVWLNNFLWEVLDKMDNFYLRKIKLSFNC